MKKKKTCGSVKLWWGQQGCDGMAQWCDHAGPPTLPSRTSSCVVPSSLLLVRPLSDSTGLFSQRSSTSFLLGCLVAGADHLAGGDWALGSMGPGRSLRDRTQVEVRDMAPAPSAITWQLNSQKFNFLKYVWYLRRVSWSRLGHTHVSSFSE